MFSNFSPTIRIAGVRFCSIILIGSAILSFGKAINDYILPQFAKLTIDRDHFLSGEVIHIDGFGNVISNISKYDLDKFGFNVGDLLHIQVEDTILNLKYSSTYGNVSDGSPLALIGGSNFLELAINQGTASNFFDFKIGNSFKVLIDSP